MKMVDRERWDRPEAYEPEPVEGKAWFIHFARWADTDEADVEEPRFRLELLTSQLYMWGNKYV